MNVFVRDFVSLKRGRNKGSLNVSRKLPINPYPKPTLTLTSHLGQNVGLGEGYVEYCRPDQYILVDGTRRRTSLLPEIF